MHRRRSRAAFDRYGKRLLPNEQRREIAQAVTALDEFAVERNDAIARDDSGLRCGAIRHDLTHFKRRRSRLVQTQSRAISHERPVDVGVRNEGYGLRPVIEDERETR